VFDKSQPLWLPKGSVRAILALVVVVAYVARFLGGTVEPVDFLPLVTLVIGYYFGQKAAAPSPA
jgi:hypothetical protein